MDWDSLHLTSATFWQSALLSALIAAAGIFILARYIDRARFRRLKWPLVISSVIFWSVLGTLLIQLTWESYYQRFAPAWMHNGGNLIISIPLAAAQALVFHWVALCLPGQPVAVFACWAGWKRCWSTCGASTVRRLWRFPCCKALTRSRCWCSPSRNICSIGAL